MILIPGRDHDLGGGFKVRRILPFAKRRMVGPFVFLDHMGPFEAQPGQNIDVRPHPHIGLSTLTYLFEGRMVHHDSLDQRATIVPGEVNWMTAGRGIAHSERSHPDDRERARRLHGLQFWVALPDGKEDIEPSFQHYSSVPRTESTGSHSLTLVAGSGFGLSSPVRTTSPLIFAEFKCSSQVEFDLTEFAGFELAVYTVDSGSGVEVEGADGTKQALGTHEMTAGETGELKRVRAGAGSHFVLIGGEGFKTPRLIWWNLVSSTQERIDRAKSAWENKTFPNVPGETDFIPLPKT